eukprot:TRINITY_DN13755_c0_g1_i1.p1 TRINITY_DN13755_c0_g1~~TRINITY_DN13755_c0_g1_i1.p1  ORF type:complete len:283 (-),score=42.15 TRINITY_DN13755_c0_g1_i1:15-863(-)
MLVYALIFLTFLLLTFSWLFGIFWGFVFGLWYGKSYWKFSEHTAERVWKGFRELFIWDLLHYYFKFSVIYEDKEAYMMAKSQPCVHAMHPHGLMAITSILGFGLYGTSTDCPKDVLIATSRLVYKIPFVRDIGLWLGGIDAKYEVLTGAIDKGHSILILPGGVQEMVLANRSRLDIYTKHKGFARLAFEKNSPIIPIFAKGENRVVIMLNAFNGLKRWFIAKTGYPIPSLFIGPLPTKLTMVIGKPMFPSDYTSLEELHKAFYENLSELINKHESNPVGQII